MSSKYRFGKSFGRRKAPKVAGDVMMRSGSANAEPVRRSTNAFDNASSGVSEPTARVNVPDTAKSSVKAVLVGPPA